MLTEQQQIARKNKLTASRVAVLMRGDADGIMRLYQEMRGEIEPEDLRHIWAVRLGEATESLQLDWFEEKNAMPVTRRGEVVVHPEINWAACTLDGFVADNDGYVIECKHVGGREPLEIIIERYQPQIQWTMFVTNTKQVALSVIMGASEPIIEYIERAPDYIDEMLARAKQFMRFLELGEPPVALDPVPPPVDANRLYDMSENETWQRYAAQWLQVKGAADSAKEAEKVLKSLVAEDSKKSYGCGVRISRDRAGRLSLREDS